MNPTKSRQAIGLVAYAYGARLRVEVLESAEGFYIGTRGEELPFSRESVEYYSRRAEAERALTKGTWTQRVPTAPKTAALSASF